MRARRRKRRMLWVVSIFFVLAIVGGSSVWLAHAPFLHIDTIVVSGAVAVPQGAIKSVVEQDIAGAYLWVYPKNNILLYPKSAIQKQLLAQFPTLTSVEVHLQDLHTIKVVVVERKPVAVWCSVDALTPRCFLLDEGGLVYAAAPSYSGDAYKKYSGAGSAGTFPWHYLPQQTFHSLTALVDAIEKKVEVTRVSGVSVDAQDDVHLTFENGFEVLFALHDETGAVFERFVLALGAPPFTAHPLDAFAYLDLRFGDKLYYKLR